VFYPFLDFVNWLTPGDAFSLEDMSSVKINLALYHTLFNFANICLCIGFSHRIARLVEIWVKEKPMAASDEGRLTYISSQMVQMSELSLVEANEAIIRMAAHVKLMFRGFLEVFSQPNQDMGEKVVELKRQEEESDQMTVDITQYLVRCSMGDISERHSALVTSMMRIVSELEEISDCCYRLVKLTERRYRKKRELPAENLQEIQQFAQQVIEFITLCQEMLKKKDASGDLDKAHEIEDAIDASRKAMNKLAMTRMQDGSANIKAEMLVIEVNNHFEKIGNHAHNIAESIAQKE